jgi:hypothetical protein
VDERVELADPLGEGVVVGHLSLDGEDRGLERALVVACRRGERPIDERHEPLGGVVALGIPESCREVLVEGGEKRQQEVLFGVVVVVECRLTLGRLVRDVLHREIRIAVLAEGGVGRVDEFVGHRPLVLTVRSVE